MSIKEKLFRIRMAWLNLINRCPCGKRGAYELEITPRMHDGTAARPVIHPVCVDCVEMLAGEALRTPGGEVEYETPIHFTLTK